MALSVSIHIARTLSLKLFTSKMYSHRTQPQLVMKCYWKVCIFLMDSTLAICMSDDKKKIENVIFTASNINLTTWHRPVFPWRCKLSPI